MLAQAADEKGVPQFSYFIRRITFLRAEFLCVWRAGGSARACLTCRYENSRRREREDDEFHSAIIWTKLGSVNSNRLEFMNGPKFASIVSMNTAVFYSLVLVACLISQAPAFAGDDEPTSPTVVCNDGPGTFTSVVTMNFKSTLILKVDEDMGAYRALYDLSDAIVDMAFVDGSAPVSAVLVANMTVSKMTMHGDQTVIRGVDVNGDEFQITGNSYSGGAASVVWRHKTYTCHISHWQQPAQT